MCCQCCEQQVVYTQLHWTVATGKLVTLIAGKWHRLLFVGVDDEVFTTRSFNLTLKTTEVNCTHW